MPLRNLNSTDSPRRHTFNPGLVLASGSDDCVESRATKRNQTPPAGYSTPGTGGSAEVRLATPRNCLLTDTFTPSIVGAESATLNVAYNGVPGGSGPTIGPITGLQSNNPFGCA